MSLRAPFPCHCERPFLVIASALSLSLRAPFPCHCERPFLVIASALSLSLRAPFPCHCERPFLVIASALSLSLRAPFPLSLRAPFPLSLRAPFPCHCERPFHCHCERPFHCHCERPFLVIASALSLSLRAQRGNLVAIEPLVGANDYSPRCADQQPPTQPIPELRGRMTDDASPAAHRAIVPVYANRHDQDAQQNERRPNEGQRSPYGRQPEVRMQDVAQ